MTTLQTLKELLVHETVKEFDYLYAS